MRIVLALALLATPVLSAQAPSGSGAADLRNDVFVGAAFNGDNPSGASTGVGGGADFHLIGPLGADGQVAVYSNGTNGTNTITLVDYLFGPRVQARLSSHVAPFADFLVGGQTLSNSSRQHSYYYSNGIGFAAAGDAGADVRLARRIALRGQFGFVFSEFAVSSPGPSGNYRWRAGVNLIYRF
jgi:hypothetical protein